MSPDEYVPDETDWTYDAEAGAAYLSLRHGRVRSSEEVGELFVVDFGQDDKTVGIEVLSSADAALIDAWLARVRRDAKAEAWDEAASHAERKSWITNFRADDLRTANPHKETGR